jgi:hypothetical protein
VLPARASHDEVYLRRAESREALPPGWLRHPAGRIDGVHLDFVYRPDRHDICRALGALSHQVMAGMREAGYQKTAAFDGGVELWVRDRPAAMRARLAGFRVLEGGRARTR